MSRREMDEKMIRDPNRWPCWPRLPLKKRDGSFKTGILYEDAKYLVGTFRVYMGNMFSSSEEIKDFTDYGSVEELLNDGWTVD